MSSFGEGILVTPLQLAALSAVFANGGTLYYLQYPRSPEEVQNFTPKVKRELNIGPILPEIREGMLAAVLYGTGKPSYDRGGEELPLGKTGTCDDRTTPSKIGWFISYADETHPRIALAVLLRGNTRRVKGPTAAQVAGFHGAFALRRGLRVSDRWWIERTGRETRLTYEGGWRKTSLCTRRG